METDEIFILCELSEGLGIVYCLLLDCTLSGSSVTFVEQASRLDVLIFPDIGEKLTMWPNNYL